MVAYEHSCLARKCEVMTLVAAGLTLLFTESQDQS